MTKVSELFLSGYINTQGMKRRRERWSRCRVQGVHTQEWVHVCGLFARNSLIDVVFQHLFKSPDVHGHGDSSHFLFKSPDVHSHGVALAVVEEVEGEDVAEWVHSYYGMGLDQHFSP